LNLPQPPKAGEKFRFLIFGFSFFSSFVNTDLILLNKNPRETNNLVATRYTMKETVALVATADDSCTDDGTFSRISVKLAKAFVQPDGSHGNGAGVVLLPGNLRDEIEHSNAASQASNDNDHLFPSDDECLDISKRVGLPETSFVLFLKKDGGSSENVSLLEDENAQEDSDGGCVDGDGCKVAADFHVKWYTPEREVDMCGHATVALAGYIHSVMTARATKAGTCPQESYFWRMQCRAGLLGIEVQDGCARNRIAPAGVSSLNSDVKGDTDIMNNDCSVSLSRVVMEQALPEFCGVIDCTEIAASLNIEVENDLAISIIDDNKESQNRTSHERTERAFPFPHCEIVSTGGRDLMIPVRSTVLKEMDILGDGSFSTELQQLCDEINIVSKRHDLVGYHMFEVDDSLFSNKTVSESVNEATTETKPTTESVGNKRITEGQKSSTDCPMHLNELIRIFQMAKEKGISGSESCFEAVVSNQNSSMDDDSDDKNTSEASAPIVKHSRIILVTGIRNFAPFVGIPEEPATGSANGALACYFVKHLFFEACSSDSPIRFRFSMEQGRAMGEPCLIDAEIEVVNGTIGTVEVGGLVNVTGDSLDLDLNSIRHDHRNQKLH
jgi:predicted PhzF superfamily epimerase YddE/YHI9